MKGNFSRTRENERSWAIDLISQINLKIERIKDSPIQKAGGEMSLSVKDKVLFPDVLLFGDQTKTTIIQGWELKLPDTSINDKEFYENAKSKAESMGTNSFLLWNVSEAKLFIREDKDFILYKHWDNGRHITSREEMTMYKADIDLFLDNIINDLNYFFRNGVISSGTILRSIVSENVIDIAFRNIKECSKSLKRNSTKDIQFRDDVNLWWVSEKTSYPDKADKWVELSKIAIVSFINKFIFSNVLKKYHSAAQLINEANKSKTAKECLLIFEEISSKCDFYNILEEKMGERYIDNGTFQMLLEFNSYLMELDFSEFSNELLEELLTQVVVRSRRKGTGQFATPQEVSLLLSTLTFSDGTARVLDPCCGTGTIAKTMYDYKRYLGIPEKEAISQVWAGDKFRYPLQFAMLALSSPENIGRQINIYRKDVFHLHKDETLTLHKPYSSEKVEVTTGKFDAILSNLPFIKSKTFRDNNPDILPIIDELNINFSQRADAYAYITIKLNELLKENGRVGLVLSNSWLGSDFGDEFFSKLQEIFHILYVVNSGKGRWFKNAKVVSVLLIMEKRTSSSKDITKFVKINKFLSELIPNDETRIEKAENLARGIRRNITSNNYQIRTYSPQELQEYENLGPLKNALFADCSWLFKIESSLVPISEYFDISRGIRRGSNEFFYPQNHNIEPEYIEPVLKNLDNSSYRINNKDLVDGFFCSKTIQELEELGHDGALDWIKYYEKNKTRSGAYLPTSPSVKRAGHFWYEMRDEKLFDMVLMLNPYERLFFSRGETRLYSDQRLINFSLRNNHSDFNLYFALANSIISLFYIEALGFGRGDGVLDLSKDRLPNRFKILNPKLLNDTQKQDIVSSFKPIESRSVHPLPIELDMDDRKRFDKTVLRNFGIEEEYDSIKDSLLDLYSMRLSVKDIYDNNHLKGNKENKSDGFESHKLVAETKSRYK